MNLELWAPCKHLRYSLAKLLVNWPQNQIVQASRQTGNTAADPFTAEDLD